MIKISSVGNGIDHTQAAFKSTPKIKRVLDIGCKAGDNTIKLSQYVSPFDCDLVDLSLPTLERAQVQISEINTGNINKQKVAANQTVSRIVIPMAFNSNQ